jgi:hypothetical protein
LKTLQNPFSDISASHWAYWQVIEASVLHEYVPTEVDTAQSVNTDEDTDDDVEDIK